MIFLCDFGGAIFSDTTICPMIHLAIVNHLLQWQCSSIFHWLTTVPPRYLIPGYTCSMSSFSVHLELRWPRFQDTLGDEGGELMVNSYHHQATLTRVPRSPMYHDFKDGTSCWDQLVNSCKLTLSLSRSLSLSVWNVTLWSGFISSFNLLSQGKTNIVIWWQCELAHQQLLEFF
jgi:hypothetical protein